MSDTSQGPGWWQASDGKWYPPGDHTAPPPPPPPSRQTSSPVPPPPVHGRSVKPPPPFVVRPGRQVWPWLLLGALVLLVGSCAVSLLVIGRVADEYDEVRDEALRQVDCRVLRTNLAGNVVVELVADNSTSKRSDFHVEYEVLDGTTFLGDGFAVLANVPAGVIDTQESHTDIAVSGSVDGLTCAPIAVRRFAST